MTEMYFRKPKKQTKNIMAVTMKVQKVDSVLFFVLCFPCTKGTKTI